MKPSHLTANRRIIFIMFWPTVNEYANQHFLGITSRFFFYKDVEWLYQPLIQLSTNQNSVLVLYNTQNIIQESSSTAKTRRKIIVSFSNKRTYFVVYVYNISLDTEVWCLIEKKNKILILWGI